MKKFNQLITNRYALALVIIAMAALLCIMSSSEWTLGIILSKAIGFALVYVYDRLFKKWDKAGKIDIIKELFNDDHEEE
jgi:membrane protein implicated in regulation of membrane protease activity